MAGSNGRALVNPKPPSIASRVFSSVGAARHLACPDAVQAVGRVSAADLQMAGAALGAAPLTLRLPRPTMSNPDPVEQDAPDLLQLLGSLGFAHWHSLLMELCGRFDGWIVDYLQSPESSPDYRPLVDIVKALQAFPRDKTGDDLEMAKALAGCDFLVRAARDRWCGQVSWDPFAEPHTAFAQRFPERYPYWEDHLARGEPAVTAWMLDRLPPRFGASGTPEQA
jgi:hypothetical protein